jgi:hypothetical protein
MKSPGAHGATTATRQLLASQLVQDLRDLRGGVTVEDEERRRLHRLRALAEAAERGAKPVLNDREGSAQGGALAPSRSKQLATLDRDEELFMLVRQLRGDSAEGVEGFAEKVKELVDSVLSQSWQAVDPGLKLFAEGELEPFLKRMERLDELDDSRAALRHRTLVDH